MRLRQQLAAHVAGGAMLVAVMTGVACDDSAAASGPTAPPSALDSSVDAALERAFPGHAARIVGAAVAPAVDDAARMAHAGVAQLPLDVDASGAPGEIVLRLGDIRARVTAHDLAGGASVDGSAVVYARADGGTSYWTAAADGAGSVEEWLDIPNPRDPLVASWTVHGARMRSVNATSVALYAESGETDRSDEAPVRAMVSAPEAWGADGAPLALELVVDGDTLALFVDDAALTQPRILVDPVWYVVGAMAAARTQAGVALGSDGRLLALYGYDLEQAPPPGTTTIERYSPHSGAWFVTYVCPDGAGGRNSATALGDGRVLSVGVPCPWLSNGIVLDPDTWTWTATTSPPAPSLIHATTTLLGDGTVLVTGGQSGPMLPQAWRFDPVTDAWTQLPDMAVARDHHAATLLRDGRVLVTGGNTSSTSAQLFDPDTSTWSAAANLPTARKGHTATQLHDGRVLVAGGVTASGAVTGSAQIYTPSTNSWSAAAALSPARAWHTATVLPYGDVLVAGGATSGEPPWDVDGALTSVKAYRPATNTWLTQTSLATARALHNATMLPDGRVLIAGGTTALDSSTSSSVLYDPSFASWGGTQPIPSPRVHHTHTTLPNGKILIAGGEDDNGAVLSSALLYDPGTSTFTSTGSLISARRRHTATLMNDGRVLIAGGRGSGVGATSSCEIYDPATGAFESTGALPAAIYGHAAVLVDDGRVLALGGTTGFSKTSGVRAYDPAAGTWSNLSAMNAARSDHRAVLLSGKILIVGGETSGTTRAALYDVAAQTSTWTSAMAHDHGQTSFSATLLPNGLVLVAGGLLGRTPLYVAETMSAAGTWTSVPDQLSIGRADHTATLLPNGRVVFIGGREDLNFSTVDEYDPALKSFLGTLLSLPRARSTASVLPNGQVLVVGGVDMSVGGESLQTYAQKYDEGRMTWLSAAPILGTITGAAPGGTVDVTGFRVTCEAEGAGGNYFDSATNLPLLRMERVDSGQLLYPRRAAAGFLDASFTLPAGTPRGWWTARLSCNGMISSAKLLLVD